VNSLLELVQQPKKLIPILSMSDRKATHKRSENRLHKVPIALVLQLHSQSQRSQRLLSFPTPPLDLSDEKMKIPSVGSERTGSSSSDEVVPPSLHGCEIGVGLLNLCEDGVEGGLGGFTFGGEGCETGLVDGDSGFGLSDGVFESLGRGKGREVSLGETRRAKGEESDREKSRLT